MGIEQGGGLGMGKGVKREINVEEIRNRDGGGVRET